jgi:protein TonB
VLLDESALSAVRRWRFVPAQRAGAAIDSWVDVPVSFRLES